MNEEEALRRKKSNSKDKIGKITARMKTSPTSSMMNNQRKSIRSGSGHDCPTPSIQEQHH